MPETNMAAEAAAGGNAIISLLVLVIVVALLMYTVYKGLNTLVACCVAACLVALGSGLPLYDTMLGSFMTGATTIISSMFFCILLSIIFGQLYLHSGAANAIGSMFERIFVGKSQGKAMQLRTAYTFYALALVLCCCGMNAYVGIFALLPMGMVMFQRANLPKRHMLGVFCSALSIAICCPGTPLYTNVLASMFFGTPGTAAAIPGIVGCLVMLLLCVFYIRSFVRKAEKSGEGFEIGNTPMLSEAPGRKMPNPFVALIPLLVNVILYGFVGLAIEPALLIGIALAVLLFFPYFKAPDEKLSFRPFNRVLMDAVGAVCPVVLIMAAQMGYAAVVSETSAFGMLIGIFSSLPLPGHVAFGIFAALSGFLAGDSVAGLAFSSNVFLAQADLIGVSAAAMHRIALFAIAILDTLPICGGIIAILSASGMTHKEGYGPMFRTSVVYVFFGFAACILMCVLFPGLT